jgi:teichuronic acid biosynthesis glycosyltransferase TuaG
VTPLVSVVVPAYRCEATIEQSVRSALCGTVTDVEVVVVNDASDDGTAAALDALAASDARVRVITLPSNGGVANARNVGVEAAKADLIAFLDSDDLWEPEKLARELAVMRETGADLICTAAACIDADGNPTGKVFRVPEAITAKRLLFGNDIVTSTVLLRRETAQKHPMERSDLHEDMICWYRILNDGGRAVGIDEPLARYRVTKGSKAGDKRKSAGMMWNTYRHLGVGPFRRLGCFLGYILHGVKRYWL